jgi:hypothetical protein
MSGSHRRGKREPADDLFDRWQAHRQDEHATTTAEEAAPAARPGPPPAGPSTNVEFAPRTQARRVVGLVLLITLSGAAVAAYAVYQDRTTLTIGLATTLGVLALVVWAVRAGTPTTRLAVRAGQLEVLQGGGRFVFELTGGYTPIEVRGQPGDRDWRVLFLRRNMDPFVIDSSMVDPDEFMRVLRRYLPE